MANKLILPDPQFAMAEHFGSESDAPAHLAQLQASVRRAFHLLVSGADDGTSELMELPVSQFRCLRRIIERDGCKLVDLARVTNLSLPNASRLVDRLVQRNLVSRQTDATDRRAIRLHATAEAREMIAAINRQRLKHISVATRTLSREQIEVIQSQLDMLISAAEHTYNPLHSD